MNDPLANESLAGFRILEFDLPSALLEQVLATFEGMDASGLTAEATASIPNAQGVYQLFHCGKLVYIGKTDAEAGLRQRLTRHAWAILSRHNLNVAEMQFKAVQVLVFSAMDLETALIKHYKKLKHPPVWNGSGFGNNDPGRKRDRTALKEDGFDALYPINIDLPLDITVEMPATAFEVLAALSSQLPFTVRHEKTDSALATLKGTQIGALGTVKNTRNIVARVCGALPTGWQATRLSGRVIIYQEEVDDYPGGEIIARS